MNQRDMVSQACAYILIVWYARMGIVSKALSSAGAAGEKPKVAAGKGPRKALATLGLQRRSIAENSAWMESARLEAVLGSCRRSLPSVR